MPGYEGMSELLEVGLKVLVDALDREFAAKEASSGGQGVNEAANRLLETEVRQSWGRGFFLRFGMESQQLAAAVAACVEHAREVFLSGIPKACQPTLLLYLLPLFAPKSSAATLVALSPDSPAVVVALLAFHQAAAMPACRSQAALQQASCSTSSPCRLVSGAFRCGVPARAHSESRLGAVHFAAWPHQG
jgi:hypothetical protein